MRARIHRYVPVIAMVLAAPLALSAPADAGATVCTLSVDDVSAPEGDAGTKNFTFTITQSGTSTSTTVTYQTANGSATAPSDYTSTSGSVTVGGTEPQTATVDVPVHGDTAQEPNETFFLDISDESGTCTVADNRGTGTIENDDMVPTGYRLTARDGGVFAYGESTYRGSASQLDNLQAPIVGIAETQDRAGYWQVATDGGVFAWNAPFFGSAGSLPLNEPVLAMAARPQDDGYWLVALDGGVFAYGDAPFLGNAASVPGTVIVDIVSTSTGNGYWLLDANGTVYAYGDAVNFGRYNARDVEAVGMAPTPDDKGYWIVNWPGQVFEFGTAMHHGDIDNPEGLNGSITGIEALAAGGGYWLVGYDGGVFAYDAPFYGSAGSLELVAPVVAMAGRR